MNLFLIIIKKFCEKDFLTGGAPIFPRGEGGPSGPSSSHASAGVLRLVFAVKIQGVVSATGQVFLGQPVDYIA